MYEHVQYAATTNQLVAWHQYTLTCGHTKVAQVTLKYLIQHSFKIK